MVFGAAAVSGEYAAYVSALVLAFGMAIQNFPEGAAVSLPVKSDTGSRGKAFFVRYGKRRGRARCSCCGLFRRRGFDIRSTVVAGVFGGRHDFRRGGGSYTWFAPCGESASWDVERHDRFCADDGA